MYFSLLIPLLVGILYIVSGIPLWRRTVPPNAAYGFRTKLTLSSEEIWYDVNEQTGKLLSIAGCLLLLFAVFCLAPFSYSEIVRKYWEYLLVSGVIFLSLLPVAIDLIAYRAKYAKRPALPHDSEPRP